MYAAPLRAKSSNIGEIDDKFWLQRRAAMR